MYKKMKVFDVRDGMPDHIIEIVRTIYEVNCNGCYFTHEVKCKTYLDEADDGTETVVENEEYTELDTWLADVIGCHIGEYVLILYWW